MFAQKLHREQIPQSTRRLLYLHHEFQPAALVVREMSSCILRVDVAPRVFSTWFVDDTGSKALSDGSSQEKTYFLEKRPHPAPTSGDGVTPATPSTTRANSRGTCPMCARSRIIVAHLRFSR